MVKRSVCLCEGQYIGIETIYTVIDGKQINDAEKLKTLRKKSNEKKLLCACGCEAVLVLVAGENNLRAQHFRLAPRESDSNCQMVTEGKVSIDSKVVLKCWLDAKLGSENIECRVPVSAISDTERKYEFTFISKKHHVAVNYNHDKINLTEEKLNTLDKNRNGKNIVHIVDFKNEDINGQYPERMMRVQSHQKFCLILQVEGRDYDKAIMRSVYYYKDARGLWSETVFADFPLYEYGFDIQGEIILQGQKVSDLARMTAKKCEEDVKAELKRLEDIRKFQAAEQERLRVLREKENEEQRQRKKIAVQERIKAEEQRLAEEAARKAEEKLLEDIFWASLPSLMKQQEKPVYDPKGVRWYKCRECDIIGREDKFTIRGATTIGCCRNCARNGTCKPKSQEVRKIEKTKIGADTCPFCGARLVNGFRKYKGRILKRCSRYPACDFEE